ncbi:hypothetical protein SAMN05216241_1039 [Limimonas halophila]|uniref:Uncharacterized protein n=1 Tax=Limimonas halophila TaxID=1082479 RepID=A0A1G7PPA0_9PROT|nr:hypothetical protein [Limimonas halophila]SDF88067.1 hypothetical protein SAMN05216241_1039 [Limimonas halophila]
MQTMRLAIGVIVLAVVVGSAASYFGMGSPNTGSGDSFGNGPVIVTE